MQAFAYLLTGLFAAVLILMAAAATRRYTGQGLIPSRWPETSETMAVRLYPGTYAQGTALGMSTTITDTNDQQTLTITGTPTGGNIYLLFNGVIIGPLAYNAAAADLQALLDACTIIGVGQTVVTGGALPGTGLIITFSGTLTKSLWQTLMTVQSNNLTGGATPAASIAHTTLGGSKGGLFGPYNSANTDGTQSGRGFLKYAAVVDNYGNITVGGGEWGNQSLTATMYNRGVFDSSKTPGIDNTFVTTANGRYITGGSGSIGTAGIEVQLP